MKCLLGDAMLTFTQNASSPSAMSPSPSPSTSAGGHSPLSPANASLLANSPAGSADGAVNKRSISEAQGQGEARHMAPGLC